MVGVSWQDAVRDNVGRQGAPESGAWRKSIGKDFELQAQSQLEPEFDFQTADGEEILWVGRPGPWPAAKRRLPMFGCGVL